MHLFCVTQWSHWGQTRANTVPNFIFKMCTKLRLQNFVYKIFVILQQIFSMSDLTFANFLVAIIICLCINVRSKRVFASERIDSDGTLTQFPSVAV